MSTERRLIQKIAACPHLALCRSECGLIKDPRPCVDYIGPRYRGLVIVGANPGIATTQEQKANDALMFDLQDALAAGDREAFDTLMRFIPQSMLGWRQVVNRRARDFLKYDIDEVAYVNLVKCGTTRTSSDIHSLFKGGAGSIPKRCWDTHTRDLLDYLKPSRVVALWKPIRSNLARLGFSFDGVEKFGAHNGSRSVSFDDKFLEIKPIFDQFNEG